MIKSALIFRNGLPQEEAKADQDSFAASVHDNPGTPLDPPLLYDQRTPQDIASLKLRLCILTLISSVTALANHS